MSSIDCDTNSSRSGGGDDRFAAIFGGFALGVSSASATHSSSRTLTSSTVSGASASTSSVAVTANRST